MTSPFTRIRLVPPNSLLLAWLGALAPMLGVASYALLQGRIVVALVGLLAPVSLALALVLRARNSIRSVENGCARLEQALAKAEAARDGLAAANEELAHANVELRAMHIAFADLLNLADERTQGRMRALIEETGEELAELLEEQLQPERVR